MGHEMYGWIIKKHQRAFNYSVCVWVKDVSLDITGFSTHILSSPFIACLVSYLKAFSASLWPKIALLRSPAKAAIAFTSHQNIYFTPLHKQLLSRGLPPVFWWLGNVCCVMNENQLRGDSVPGSQDLRLSTLQVILLPSRFFLSNFKSKITNKHKFDAK